MSGDDEMIRRMAANAQRQGQGMTVAAPFNDVQLVAIMAAIIYAGNRDAITKPEQPVSEAIDLVATSVAAIRVGALNQAIQKLMTEPTDTALSGH